MEERGAVTEQQPFLASSDQLDALAKEIYASLAAQFPVCLSSDEFHFFPQFKAEEIAGSPWDDFSDNAVGELISRINLWQRRLHGLRPPPHEAPMTVSIDMLSRVLTTMEEQLRLVRPHKTQPTFYLTIISIGLAEALDESREVFKRRVESLPSFVSSAILNLSDIPVVFKALAMEMLPKFCSWVKMLPLTHREKHLVAGAMDQYEHHLNRVNTRSDFRLEGALYARIADFHMGCNMALDEIAMQLDNEIETTARLLAQSAERIAPGKPWQQILHELPPPGASHHDVRTLWQKGIAQLKEHCLECGFVDEHIIAGCDVEIHTIGEHMRPVRANAAYSMPPGHPPKGGIFYLLPLDHQSIPRDMMLLAAHETYPGHHLLDTLRWQLKEPLRRCLEFPIFYEGWACLSEELLFDTQFFSGPVDRLLTAKRRFWRACRGRAEFRIHTGQGSLEEEAAELAHIGLVGMDKAMAMVRRYALKPGYQLSYAIGRRKFRKLYKACLDRGYTSAEFVRRALHHGEMDFHHLGEILLDSKKTNDREVVPPNKQSPIRRR